eukprot:UN11974
MTTKLKHVKTNGNSNGNDDDRIGTIIYGYLRSVWKSKQFDNIVFLPYELIQIIFSMYSVAFIYESHFDKNGICYWLGTNFGKSSEWTNPSKMGLIKIRISSLMYGRTDNIVGRLTDSEVCTIHRANSWVTIDFGPYKIIPTAYSLRHGYGVGMALLRNWYFEGSNDANKWVKIKTHRNDRALCYSYQLHTWNIPNCAESFKMFRIYQYGRNSSHDNDLCMNGFEVYGQLNRLQTAVS